MTYTAAAPSRRSVRTPEGRKLFTNGATRDQSRCNFAKTFKKAKTSSGWASAFLTVGQCLTTSPFGPITTVERMVPCTSLPYIIFLPKAPYFFITSRFGSDSKTNGSLYFAGKLLVRFGAVLAHAEHHSTGFFDVGVEIAKAAGFFGAAGRVILGIKVQHDGFVFVVFQRMRFAVVAFQAEGRRFFSFEIHVFT